MKIRWNVFLIVIVAAICCALPAEALPRRGLGVAKARPDAVAAGTQAAPALHWTFDDGPNGWRVVFGPGEARITVAREHVKVGTGALENTYEIAARTYFAVAREVNLPAVPVITLTFWIKSMHAKQLAIFLTERDASGYGYRLELPMGLWKRVTVSSSQFVLDTTSAGNKDENGKLDVGQVEWITIADFAGLFSNAKAKGSFYLDDFRLGP